MGSIELHRYFKEMIDVVSDGLMVVGKDGNILMVNSHMENLTGFSSEEMVGSTCTILNCDVCEIRRCEGNSQWCKLFDVGRVRGKRCMIMKKDGTYVSALKNATLLREKNGDIIGAVETFTDISQLDQKDLQIRQLSKILHDGQGYFGMVGRSSAMERIFQIIEKAALSDAPVVIYGESGTGKDLTAHAVHQLGRRKDKPFIRFNCAALGEGLIESELFGYAKGAFAGALSHSQGRFESAHGGDIFLDEISGIPLGTQAKLLRLLETKRLERVGDNREVYVDTRLIASTNQDLSQLVRQGRFREDLFFRINVMPIHLPPLRERKEDIPLLAGAFMSQLRQKSGKLISGLHPKVLSFFMEYDWPGNVRELKSALEYAFVIAETGMIEPGHLPESFQVDRVAGPSMSSIPEHSVNAETSDEKQALIDALQAAGGNKSAAAKILGVNRMTVWNRMRKNAA
ncbi:MAG: sigma 54-interacting transcriptional regulator [Desulfobacteraceae bacterium]